jgi:hypothetical protein
LGFEMLALRLGGIIARPNAGARVKVSLKNRSENENGNEHQEVKNEGRNAQKMEVPADFPPVEKSKLDPQGLVPTGEPGYLNGPAPVDKGRIGSYVKLCELLYYL